MFFLAIRVTVSNSVSSPLVSFSFLASSFLLAYLSHLVLCGLCPRSTLGVGSTYCLIFLVFLVLGVLVFDLGVIDYRVLLFFLFLPLRLGLGITTCNIPPSGFKVCAMGTQGDVGGNAFVLDGVCLAHVNLHLLSANVSAAPGYSECVSVEIRRHRGNHVRGREWSQRGR